MKYRLTKEVERHILHRIEYVESFGEVKAGDKGGWIERGDNLSAFCNYYRDGKN